MKKGVRDFAFAVAFVSLLSTSAYGDDSVGVDEVTLKSGGAVRGTVVSVEPGSKVVILEFGQKQARTLTWAEVADVQKGKYAKAAETAEPGPAGPGYDRAAPQDDEEDPEKPPGPGVVKVHIESDRPVELYEHIGTSMVAVGRYIAAVTHGRVVCQSPCDLVVDGSRGQDFIITGPGVPSSKTFRLHGRTEDTTVNVDTGSTAGRVGGIVMISVGGAGLLAGAVTILFGALPGLNTNAQQERLFTGGGVTLGVGAGLLAGGIAVVVASRTTIEVQGDKRQAGVAPGERFLRDTRPAAIAPRYWLGEF